MPGVMATSRVASVAWRSKRTWCPTSPPGRVPRSKAMRLAAARAAGAKVVLLSPACASFDQFSGFDARGSRFAELAAGLGRH